MDSAQETGSFMLSSLLADIQLSGDGQRANVYITCVDFWSGNLYVGTSASEVLHFVRLPPDPNIEDEQAIFVPGTRLEPKVPDAHSNARQSAGIQQILILPEDSKACILCDGYLSFYNLPELSPAFEATKPISCLWVGGVDQNALELDKSDSGVSVMLCLKSKIRIVRIGDGPRKIRDIVLEGCQAAIRRDNIACIADTQSYSLLDIVQQQQIPLSPISTISETTVKNEDSIRASSHSASSSISKISHATSNLPSPERGHSKSASLGNLVSRADVDQLYNKARTNSQERPLSQISSTSPSRSPDRRSNPARKAADFTNVAESQTSRLEPPKTLQTLQQRPLVALKPLIASPNSSEFLFVTGSSHDAPGVGMFVNLDGEPSRGTLEFAKYPEAIAIDGTGVGPASTPIFGEHVEDGYVLAVMKGRGLTDQSTGLEIQRWDTLPGEGGGLKDWLEIVPGNLSDAVQAIPVGIRSTLTPNEVILTSIGHKLGLKQLDPKLERGDSDPKAIASAEASRRRREVSEVEYIKRLISVTARVLVWHGTSIWCAVRNPLVTRLDAQLPKEMIMAWQGQLRVTNIRKIEFVINSIRGQEPQTELDFTGLAYIRQKASLLLFMDTLKRSASGGTLSDIEERLTAQTLKEGDIDPRVLLILLPTLRDEVLLGSDGIWIQGDLKTLVEQFLESYTMSPTSGRNIELTHPQLIKNYLLMWRRKKGNASVTSVKEVFLSVDAALLHLLLIMDNPRNPQRTVHARSELYNLAEEGIECFKRGIQLLEKFKRLYVLSILYQSRTMSGKVLETWRRILEGEHDEGADFTNGENKMHKYLLKIKDAKLVEEYGIWLANRNPALGVRVFADDMSKVKFDPKQAVAILRKSAPGAVKEYLEHLVFGKNLAIYANDLIGHYLSSVLNALEDESSNARSALLLSYDSYRALKPPKPTYSQFVADNALDAEWWRNRLRLLQLLGGSHGAASNYDVPGIIAQLEPYQHELIPEMIVLDGRQGRHREAIRLLTHGLGDFDTAISYCLLGGASIYSPSSGAQLAPDAITSREDQMALFGYLLEEFFRIQDSSDRILQTSELLGRFSGWFDVSRVLELVPDEWSVELVSDFLESAFRRLVSERQETAIARALVSVENMTATVSLLEKVDALGPLIDGGPELDHVQ